VNYLSDSKLEDILNKFEDHEQRLTRLEELIKHKDETMPLWAKDLATKDELKSFFNSLTREIDLLRDDMNKRFEDMNKRFEDMNKRFEDINKRFEDINKRFEELNTHMRMYFGLLTFVVTLINTMITIIAIMIVNKP